MSYLLDALRKAERERGNAHAPELQPPSPPAVAAQPRPALWRAATLVTLLLLAAGAATILIRHRQSAPDAPPAAAATSPAPTIAAPAPSAAVVAPGQESSARTLDDLWDGGPVESSTPEESFDSAAPLSAAAPAAAASASAPTAGGEAPAEPQTEVEHVQLTPPPPPEQTVRSLKDMPPEYRAGFPALAIDVHVYDPDPRKRFVMVNGRRYHEGDTLSEGPAVREIVADGVILDYRGEAVFFGIGR